MSADAAAFPIRFRDRTPESGVVFEYQNGEEAHRYAIVESMGGGGAIFDFDRDGRGDLMMAGGGGYAGPKTLSGRRAGLFRQVGPWNWKACPEEFSVPFHDVYTHGIATGDFDSDGFPDAAVTGYGELTLSRNLGDGTFEPDEPRRIVDPSWGTCAAWGDVNGDGHLDLFVTHYLNWSFDNDPPCRGRADLRTATPSGATVHDVCPPWRFDGLPDALFLSDGAGQFVNRSKEWGLAPDGKGIGVLLADVDLDGDLDAMVCNDTTPNFLYINTRKTFEESGMIRGVALNDQAGPDGSMGVDAGDFDLDGWPDLWVTNYQHELFGLYRNLGEGYFQHSSRILGFGELSPALVGWGTAFVDFDRDGDEDLVASSGHAIQRPTGSTVAQRPILMDNHRDRRQFVDVGASAGAYFLADHKGRGLAAGDLEGDGDPDLLLVPVNESAAILENTSGEGRAWLSVRLIGRAATRNPVGARLECRSGGRSQIRLVKGGGSYASTNAEELFVGLGDSPQADELLIHWPSGKTSSLKNVAAGQRLTIVEPEEGSPVVALAAP